MTSSSTITRGGARRRSPFWRQMWDRFFFIAALLAACLAVLVTVGIMLSVTGNTMLFFALYSAVDFFFGTTWAPSFQDGSEFGLLPLLWGTIYISLIACAVAITIGLFIAIYLAEYASDGARNWIKSSLELLLGIPTIVYGLFAFLTVGPFLMWVFGEGPVEWMDSQRSVLTAGSVMGVMLIPFVSSFCSDMISKVPDHLRKASLGLGATQAETIKQVVLPAALPGIIAAVLLTKSRAIGETMIVVFGAGAAARMDLNPLEGMTTITAKIVSQLTGDVDFTGPEALVAYALSFTLTLLVLLLNVIALYIRDRYEQRYE